MRSADIPASHKYVRPRSFFAGTLGVFAASFGLALALRYYSLFPSAIDADESLYLIIAQHWLRGELPYQTVWDQHSVGLPAFFAIIQFFFDGSVVAIRVTAALAVAATATIVYSTARLLERQRLAAAIAALFYIAWTSRWWALSANCELYLNMLIAGAMYILIREAISSSPQGRQLLRYCVASLLLGLAVQVKHVAVAETALFFGVLYVLHRRADPHRKAALIASAAFCFLLPSVLVVLYFTAHGLIAEYLQAVILYNVSYLGVHPTLAEVVMRVPRSFILPFAIIIGAALAIWRSGDWHHRLVLGWAAAAIVDAALPGQFWGHYFILLLPATALLTGYLAALVEREWPSSDTQLRRTRVLLAAMAFLACNPFGVYGDIMKTRALLADDVPRSIARMIGPHPDDYIFVFNYQPIIYFLTGARLPSKHVLPGEWSQYYSSAAGVDPVAELDNVFRHNPTFVIFVDSDVVRMGAPAMQRLHDHLSDYVRYGAILDSRSMPEPLPVEIYKRRDSGAP
jgi:4-amino-4-deoxy-L-arabinose transferase-like glycosyltransferase